MSLKLQKFCKHICSKLKKIVKVKGIVYLFLCSYSSISNREGLERLYVVST